MTDLLVAFQQLEAFKRDSLRNRIRDLERSLGGSDKHSCAPLFTAEHVAPEQLAAALAIKKASSQINEVVHALGLMLSLPYILAEGETVEYVSLAAGNTGRPFDLETNKRIAEFKFTSWQGGSEAIRQNQLFKDFYYLAEYDTSKERYLYVVDTKNPLKFLSSKRALSSVMSRDSSLSAAFQALYEGKFATVVEYYRFRSSRVHIVDLAAMVPYFNASAIT